MKKSKENKKGFQFRPCKNELDVYVHGIQSKLFNVDLNIFISQIDTCKYNNYKKYKYDLKVS